MIGERVSEIKRKYHFSIIDIIDCKTKLGMAPMSMTLNNGRLYFTGAQSDQLVSTDLKLQDRRDIQLFPCYSSLAHANDLYVIPVQGPDPFKPGPIEKYQLDGEKLKKTASWSSPGDVFGRMKLAGDGVCLISSTHRDYVKEKGFVWGKISGDEFNIMFRRQQGFHPAGLMADSEHLFVYNISEGSYYKFSHRTGELLETFRLEGFQHQENFIVSCFDSLGHMVVIDNLNAVYKYDLAGRLIYVSRELRERYKKPAGFQTDIFCDQGVIYAVDLRNGSLALIGII